MWNLRTAILTVAGGLLLAVVLFIATAPDVGAWGGTVGRPVGTTDWVTVNGGVNPWTGDVRPATTSYTGATGKRVTTVVSRDFRNTVIPLPVGFAAGCLLTIGLIAIRRRLKTAKTPAASPV
jgi:hypothetical protein